MRSFASSFLRTVSVALCMFLPLVPYAAASVTITSPVAASTVAGAVTIAASAVEGAAFHLELWDNGSKLGDYFTTSLKTTSLLKVGSHLLTVLAVTSGGKVLDRSSVGCTVKVANSTPPVLPSPGTVVITSPAAGAISISAVTISAAALLSSAVQLQIWDNGVKLGTVPAVSVNGVYVLPNGSHVLTVEAMDTTGSVLSSSKVNYTVAENCQNSRNVQCDLDQLPIDPAQNDCNPKIEAMWVANSCGGGVQGTNPTSALSTAIESVSEAGALLDQGNLTLNGHSIHLSEVQGTLHPSNVLFRGQSPTLTPVGAIDTHWTLDGYVYLPDPSAHQAFEIDAQYTVGGIWTKFYTECAFNVNAGTGYWAVFDSVTGGWIVLNGEAQNGQTPPAVACNRSQFTQPWAGSSNPSSSGWHHINWTFLRDPDGTVTYQTLTFDGQTTNVNFTPISATGGSVNDSGYFSALIQLDGVVNTDGKHGTVDAYLSEVTLTHAF